MVSPRNTRKEELYELYKSLNATPGSVITMIAKSDEMTSSQSRVVGYLRTFIGKLKHRDLRNFLRFVTGSSVMIDKKINGINMDIRHHAQLNWVWSYRKSSTERITV